MTIYKYTISRFISGLFIALFVIFSVSTSFAQVQSATQGEQTLTQGSTSHICYSTSASLLRLQSTAAFSPAAAVGGDDASAAWKHAYKKTQTKGIVMMTLGGVFLAGGIAGIGVGIKATLDANSDQYITSTQDDNYSQHALIGISVGTAALVTGLVLLPIGGKYLKKAVTIKKDGRAHDITFSYAPDVNVSHGYSSVGTHLAVNF